MKITDSTGKQLADSGGNFGFMADISEDGKTIDIPIESSGVPGSGADSISVKGSVMLECGENSKTEEVDVKIASGEKVKGKAEDIKQLKVTYFQDVKEVELPLDVKFGLGF